MRLPFKNSHTLTRSIVNPQKARRKSTLEAHLSWFVGVAGSSGTTSPWSSVGSVARIYKIFPGMFAVTVLMRNSFASTDTHPFPLAPIGTFARKFPLGVSKVIAVPMGSEVPL